MHGRAARTMDRTAALALAAAVALAVNCVYRLCPDDGWHMVIID